ncbi:DUF4625 domain-containing protein [Parapedobacter deserti]|uniref:DUF4625 domain-containing protein n=1 Tax=Parapedobacter deserti TaxID=1912957 RepID=A0ABV7JT12_9SPHI
MKRNMTNKMKYLALGFMACAAMVSCNKDDDPVPSKPTIENLEIGSGNNGIGMIGRDFHLNMDIIAGELIETVAVQLRQRSDEEYAHEWSHEITWEEYRGVKNANVHKHFDIPGDAAEGLYDFVIIVNDKNGTTLEEAKEIKLIDPSKLPVDPTMSVFNLRRKVGDGDFERIYSMLEGFVDPTNNTFHKGDHLEGLASVSNLRDNGSLYLLLIKKSMGHKPETVDDIDFSKAIVCDALVHENIKERRSVSNFLLLTEWGERERPEFMIGATEDNNIPAPSPIDGDKAWENGAYYFGVVYTNSTHNLSTHYYVELTINGF